MELDELQITDFIDQSPQRSIFCYPWWLKAVTDDQYSYAVATKGEAIKGVIPYYHTRKWGVKLNTMPPYSQMLGPLLPEMQGKYATVLSKEHKYLDHLIQELPGANYYNIRLHPSLTNWLPFYWNGFQQSTRYTYILPDISDIDEVWDGMRSNIRREIRKAEDEVKVGQEDNIDLLIRLRNMTYERQDTDPSHSADLILRVYQACQEQDRGRLFFARDSQDRPHSGLFLIWDDRMAYYLIGGSDPELRTSGAASLVMWEAVKFASEFVTRFNFEGSMIRSIERFFRGFGGRQWPYMAVSKYTPGYLRLAQLVLRDI